MLKKASEIRPSDTISLLDKQLRAYDIYTLGSNLVINLKVVSILVHPNTEIEVTRTLDPYDAIIEIRRLIVKAAEVGFDSKKGTWADDLFATQSWTIEILQKAGRYNVPL